MTFTLCLNSFILRSSNIDNTCLKKGSEPNSYSVHDSTVSDIAYGTSVVFQYFIRAIFRQVDLGWYC